MTTSSTNILWTCAILASGALGCAADASPDNHAPAGERTLEDDVEGVMIERSTAALSGAPGGGLYGGECFDAWATCMDGCAQYNTRWDALKTVIWGSSNYTRCRDKCDLARAVCQGGMSASTGL